MELWFIGLAITVILVVLSILVRRNSQGPLDLNKILFYGEWLYSVHGRSVYRYYYLNSGTFYNSTKIITLPHPVKSLRISNDHLIVTHTRGETLYMLDGTNPMEFEDEN